MQGKMDKEKLNTGRNEAYEKYDNVKDAVLCAEEQAEKHGRGNKAESDLPSNVTARACRLLRLQT